MNTFIPLDTLISYVSDRVVYDLARAPAYPTQPAAERLPAAVLSVAISGLSTLPESLAASTGGAALGLSRALDSIFSQLMDLIAIHGGDIITAAGDGLIALWPAEEEDDDLQVATHRATQCGLLLAALLHGHPVAEAARLALRICIGAGEMLLIRAGGVGGSWVYLAAGAPLVEIGAAAGLAGPGQVVLTAPAWALVQDGCVGERLPGGAICVTGVWAPLLFHAAERPRLTPASAAALCAYLPAPALHQLTASSDREPNDVGLTTILSLALPDLDHTTPLEQLHMVVQWVQQALYRYGGGIYLCRASAGGVTLTATMEPSAVGGPPPLRAVLAGLTLDALLHERCIRSAIGIATGLAFCGGVGGERRRIYTQIGAVAEQAARLMLATLNGEGSDPMPFGCDAATEQTAHASCIFEMQPPGDATRPPGRSRPIAPSLPPIRIRASGSQPDVANQR